MLEVKNIFIQEKIMLQITFNPGLTLTGFQIARLRVCNVHDLFTNHILHLYFPYSVQCEDTFLFALQEIKHGLKTFILLSPIFEQIKNVASLRISLLLLIHLDLLVAPIGKE